MKNSIVTKTGDKGTTSLFGDGIRVKKNHIRVKSYGEIDELNSILGIFCSLSTIEKINTIVENLQNQLFEFGADIAIPTELYKKSMTKDKQAQFQSYISFIEDNITHLEPQLPELKNFILPGGSQESSYLHLGRTVCRRVERNIIELLENEILDKSILIYFNRLSDLLFILARYANLKKAITDVIWRSELI